MKRNLHICLLCAFTMLLTFTAYGRRVPGDKVGVSFETMVYDFGNVSEDGAPVEHEFEYTNTGDAALAIIWAKPSCGCTEPEYNRKPLKPGEKGTIKLTFSPRGQRGEVDKDVRIKMKSGNGKSEEITLRLVGTVSPKAKN